MAGTGGYRKGAGRKTKAEEDKVKTISIKALTSVFGSEEKAMMFIAKEAKTSFQHLKMIIEYAYGKPSEKVDVTSNGKTISAIQLLDVDGSEI